MASGIKAFPQLGQVSSGAGVLAPEGGSILTTGCIGGGLPEDTEPGRRTGRPLTGLKASGAGAGRSTAAITTDQYL